MDAALLSENPMDRLESVGEFRVSDTSIKYRFECYLGDHAHGLYVGFVNTIPPTPKQNYAETRA